jgi:hypothetical protein
MRDEEQAQAIENGCQLRFKGRQRMNRRNNSFGKIKARLSNDFVLFDLFSITFIVVSIGDFWSDVFPDAAEMTIVCIWIAITLVLLFKKRTDEFSTQCWNSATATAFALVVITPFLSGFIEGFIGEHRNDPDYSAGLEPKLWIVQVLLFILVFQFKRIRGSFA